MSSPGGLRRTGAALLLLPCLALAGAYLWMVRMYGRWDLWGVIVHESGLYTLGQTIFFISHFCREWPVKLVYLAAGLCLFRSAHPVPALDARRRARLGRAGWACVGLAAVLCIAAFGHAASRTGATEALRDLLQFRSNDTAPEAWGAHWRFHFLSGIAFIAGCGLIAAATGRRISAGAAGAAAALYAAVTVVALPGLEPFTDPRFLGHQFREATGTDLPVALPLLLGLWLVMQAGLAAGRAGSDPQGGSDPLIRRCLPWAVACAAPVALLALLLLSGHDVGANRPPGAVGWSLPDLYAAHTYEHSLDYLFYGLAGAGAFLLSAAGRPQAGR